MAESRQSTQNMGHPIQAACMSTYMYQHGFISLLYICTSNYDMIVSIHLLLKVTIILKILALARVYIKPNMLMLAHFPQPMLYLNYPRQHLLPFPCVYNTVILAKLKSLIESTIVCVCVCMCVCVCVCVCLQVIVP